MESLFQPMTPTHHLSFTSTTATTTRSSKSSSKTSTPEAPRPLLALPRNLQLKIFKHLDPGTSTCLGITCKHLYKIHRALHGSVPLNTRIWFNDHWGKYYYSLGHYLAAWAGRDTYYLDYDYKKRGLCKFVKWPKQKTSDWMADEMACAWYRMKKNCLLKLKGKPKKLRIVAKVEWEVTREVRSSEVEAALFDWDEIVAPYTLA